MRPGRSRLATTVVAWMALCLLAPAAVAGKEQPPKFPTQGTDALAKDSWIVTLKHGADVALAGKLAKNAGGKAGLKYTHALTGFQFKGSAKAAAALAKSPRVASVTPDHAIHLTEIAPNGILREHAWSAAGPTDGAYQAGFRGSGARIAILDTGIDLTHPDLAASIDTASGKNCLNPALPPQDGHGHGTHVSGTAAAPLNGVGVVGIAAEATLVAIKMFDDAGNSSEALSLCALDRVTELNTDANPNNDIDVASMSWGDHRAWGTCATDPLHGAICRAQASGAILVAGAGNDAVDAGDFVPSAFPEVISVSGLTDFDGKRGGLAGCAFVPSLFWFECDDTMAFFSDFGPSVDVIAPGVNVYSTWTGGGYMTIDGTSMSTPHVSGVIALMRAANPTLTPTDALQLLTSTGECPNGQIASAGGTPDCTGQGTWPDDPDGISEPLPNALRAAQAAFDASGVPTVTITSPVDGATVNGLVTVTAVATDDVGVSAVAFAVNGKPAATDSNGADGWSFAWNTATLFAGRYAVTATASDADGHSRSDIVDVQVGANLQGDWVGTYGRDGYALFGWNDSSDLLNLPNATFVLEQGARYTWEAPSIQARALESPDKTERRATTVYDAAQIRFHLTFPNAYTGTVHLYAYDLDNHRHQLVTLDDGNGQQQVDMSAPFNQGAWLHFPISVGAGGTVTVTVARITDVNAVLSGLFLGEAAGPSAIPPGAPTLDSATPGNGQAGLSWSAPSSNGGSSITGYTATASPGGATCSTSGATTCNVTGLTNGTSYSFTVTATNAVGTGPASNALSATPRTVPGAATLSSATPGNTQVSLAWSAPASDGGSPITAYTATASPGGATCATSGATTCTVNGLTNGVAYSFTVAATNAAGTGAPSNQLSATPKAVPGAPTLNSATPGNGLVSLSWSAPASDGGSPITGYLATASPGGATCSTPGATTCTVNGLTNGVSYSFTVVASNVAGPGPASNALSATPRTVPGAPTLNTATPGDSQVSLSWTAPASNGGSSITGYTATASPGGLTCSTGGATSCAIAGLTNGVSYSFSITATNAAGTGSPSNTLSATPRTVPGAPTMNTATPGNGQVSLAWSAPASNGGSTITGYTATASPGGLTCSTGGSLSCAISGLANGTPYSFTVRASNAAGQGAQSNALSATPRTTPGAPTLNSATPGDGQVSLSWTAPASNGGSAITGYTATASPGGATCSTSGATTCAITGLANGTSYSFTVRATNAAGPGSPSNALNATPRTVPGAPQSLTAAPRTPKGVNLAWSAPSTNGGSAITVYTIYRRTSGGSYLVLATVSGSTLTYRDTATAKNTQYFYVVRATNAAGEGAASNEAGAIAR